MFLDTFRFFKSVSYQQDVVSRFPWYLYRFSTLWWRYQSLNTLFTQYLYGWPFTQTHWASASCPRTLWQTAAARNQTMTFCLVIGTLCHCRVGPRRRSYILVACEWQGGFHLQVIPILQNNAITAQSLEICLFMEAGNRSDRHFWSPLTQYSTNSILTLILRG